MAGHLISDVVLILAAGLVACVVCRTLRVSVLVGYLLVGVVIGQGGLRLVSEQHHEIEQLAETGVFLLLFSIGLEFSLDALWELRRHLLVGGSVQMLLVALPVLGLMRWLGFGWPASIILASAIAFSSTVLVFGALGETGQAGSQHGRRAIGVLLFQDIALVPLLLLIPVLTSSDAKVDALDWLLLSGKSVVFVVGVVALRYLLARYVLPMITQYRSLDVVVLIAVVTLALTATSAHALGLPPAIGAFAAGLMFSGNRWTHQVDALILPFRETFSAFFFVSLGLLFDSGLIFGTPGSMALALVGLILLKWAAATLALRLTGLTWQTASGMGLGLAHVGEFAFVLALTGASAGLFDKAIYSRVIGLAIGSLTLTPLLLRLGQGWVVATQEEEEPPKEAMPEDAEQLPALVIGAGPIGRALASQLELRGYAVHILDLNPVNLYEFTQQGFETIVGDATDPATLAKAPLARMNLVVVSVPADAMGSRIVQLLRKSVPKTCKILVRCRYLETRQRLLKLGADVVLAEEALAARDLLEELD